MITLYQYLHCPYCIRVRMVLGLLKLPYKSVLLPYSDELTPVQLTGKKIAPIIERLDKTFMNESLDIIAYLDSSNSLNLKETLTSSTYKELETFLNSISGPLFNLLMPYYLNSVEFSDADRIYFQKKKEIKRGPFAKLVERRLEFMADVEAKLQPLQTSLMPFYKSKTLTILDVILASHLWGLYLANDFRVSESLHQYLQRVKVSCNFNYDYDLWLRS